MTDTKTLIETKQKVYFDLTASPHLHSQWSTAKVMWFVNLALVPCIASALIFFGIQQILIMLVAVLFAVGTEAAIQTIRKKKITLFDGSAALTGLLLALTLPPNFSLSATAIGSVIAIGLGKQIFGGIGYNIFNPALVGRAFLQAAFPVQIHWRHSNLINFLRKHHRLRLVMSVVRWVKLPQSQFCLVEFFLSPLELLIGEFLFQ
jgi:electron transport complex protein RnfD